MTLVLALLLAAAPREGIVKADVALVRSGESDKFYVTNRLARGTRVEILEDRPGGWLKIKPPAGSFSYISVLLITQITPNQPIYVVDALKGRAVPVFIGSEVVKDRRPDIAGARLADGTQVVSIGEPLKDADKLGWMPIEPPPGEVRYLHRDALEGITGTTVSSAAAAPAPGGALPPPSTRSANPIRTPEQDWAEAAEAERARNYPEAIRLWAALGARTATSHPHISTAALQRAAQLQGVARAATATTVSSPKPPVPAGSTFEPAGPTDTRAYRVRLARAGWRIDSKPTYQMDVMVRGIYENAGYAVSAGPQIQLEPWVGHEVEVTGTLWYHGQARRNVLTVTSIKSLR